MRFLLLFFSFGVTATPLNQGVEALSQKNYPQAATFFQETLKKEPDNLTAWHNLALSHLGQKQDLLAYAYWRKALVLDPGFRPAKEGLQFLMKSGKINQIPNVGFFESLNLSQLLMALFIVTFITGILLIRFLKARKQQKSSPLSILTLAIIVWVTLCGFAAFKAVSSFSTKALIMKDSVAALSAPVENGAQLFTLKGGEETEVIAKDGDWVQVMHNSLTGWIPKQDLLILDKSTPW